MEYLSKVNGYWYFRIRIPQDLRRVFPSGELKKSLKTTSFKNAKSLVKVYCYRAERLFTHVRCGMLTGTQIKKLISEYLHTSLQADEDFRITYETPADNPQVEKLQRAYQAVIEDRKAELARNDLSAIAPQADTLLQNTGIALDKDSAEYKRLCRELLKAEIAYFTVGLERYKGNYQNEYDKRFNSLFAESAASVETQESGKTLSEAITLHMKEKSLGKKLKPRSRVEYDSVYTLFQDVIAYLIGKKDVYLSSLDTDTLIKYSETLSQLPANARKSKALKDKSIGEVLEAVKDTPIKPISDATKNRNLGLISSLLKWCVRRGYMKLNPAEGLGVKESGKASEKRDAYTPKDLEILLHSPVFTNPDKGRPERFWIPFIALYSGMRLEEICQLQTADVKEAEGIPCFDVNENAPDKSVKSEAGIRLVPVHPVLIKLGFMRYVQNQKDTRLWMALERKKERYGLDFGKWYGKQIKAALFPDRARLNFHSFRHTFIDNLARAGVDWKLIKDLAGHQQEDITQGRYTKVHLDLLFEAVKELDYGIDLKHLKGKAPL